MKIKLLFYIFVIVLSFYSFPDVVAHSMFNSAEQFTGGYRVQIATLPEFPNVGETSQLLFKVTDSDFNEVDRFRMGVKIFFDGEQVDALKPQSHEGSHWQTDFVFERPGIHIFRVDLYDMEGTQSVLTYTFNMSTQTPFGYIFFLSISVGAIIFSIVMGYVYLPKIKRRFYRTHSK